MLVFEIHWHPTFSMVICL